MRLSKIVEINEPDIRQRLITWASRQEIFCVLNSNQGKQEFSDAYSSNDLLLAVGAIDQIRNQKSLPALKLRQVGLPAEASAQAGLLAEASAQAGLLAEASAQAGEIRNSFDLLKNFYESKTDWLFGFLTYDLKNEVENLQSENHDGLGFPDMHFFQPRLILKYETGNPNLEILYLEEYDNKLSVQQFINDILETEIHNEDDFDVDIQPKISKEEYVSTVNKIKQHIQRGDIYEMNYCVEFSAGDVRINPLEIYLKLNEISPMPFSSFYRLNEHYLICASPERFVAKRGSKIISQPIKGTARRGNTSEEDERVKFQLKNDPKEQSENVMIVDLVRNDLSRTAQKGSVKVEELFGIFTFPQLHHMASTVISRVREDVHFTDVIKYAFPMGSMTGAPKIRAMQLIEEFEKTKRGLYSGTVGYLSPEGDFDFNVVIRSILYNAEKKYLSFMVGSAITANSVAEKEYEECLLKAKALMQVLNLTYKV